MERFEMKSHYKKKAAGAILLIWQREPGPDVFTDTFAKRHMEFLRTIPKSELLLPVRLGDLCTALSYHVLACEMG